MFQRRFLPAYTVDVELGTVAPPLDGNVCTASELNFFAGPSLVLPDHDVIVHVLELANTWCTGDQNLRSQNQQVDMRRGPWNGSWDANQACSEHRSNNSEGLRMSRQFVQRTVNLISIISARSEHSTPERQLLLRETIYVSGALPWKLSNSCAISAKSSVDSSTSPADKFSKVRFAFLKHT